MEEILTNKRDNITVKGTVASSEPFVLYQVKQLVSNVSPYKRPINTSVAPTLPFICNKKI